MEPLRACNPEVRLSQLVRGRQKGSNRRELHALGTSTGTHGLSADALVEYFRPLTAWLQEQNSQRQCG
ncbi:M2 family metallopeptidase [Microvirga pakistanensis]|uniref:M2 family metallopeptidase n=1 Tax=Microvirga pakistanensis TaxID=1682650 RepID=UPI003CC7D98B